MTKQRRPSRSSRRAPPPAAHRVGGFSRRRRSLRLDPIALALIALSLAIRLWGIGDRLPDPTLGINVLDDTAVEETDRTTMGRAWQMWNGGTKHFDLNPHTGGWPGFSFYFGLGIQMAYKGTFVASHPGMTARDFARHIHEASNQMFIFGRVVNAVIGALTVLLAYLLGSRLAGRGIGFMAGLLLVLNPLHILISQHIADPNLLALFFVLLAALAMTRVADGAGGRDSFLAGAMIGFAAASKYTPLVLVIPLAVAHGRDSYRNRGFYLGLVGIAVAMFAASPYTFLDWKTTLQDITTQRRALFSDWVGQTSFPFSLPTYLAVSLPHAMGWPAYVLGIIGMGFLWGEGRRVRPVALIPAVIVLANGALRAAQERYVLVAIPILFVGAAMALREVWGWFRERVGLAGPAGVAVPALLGAVAIAWPLPEFIAIRHSLSLPDTRHLARKWINAHIGADRPTAVELYGPVFQPTERAIVIWPFFATQVPLVRPAYHYEWLDGLDYYVLSREVSRRFDADSAAYPVESAFYRWIRANAPILWQTDPRTSSGPEIEIRRVPASVSTRAQRDTLFAHIMPTPSHVNRLGLWCLDEADLFGRLSRFDRAEEWSRRGLKVEAGRLDPRLWGTLAFTLLNQKRFAEAESTSMRGIAIAPGEGTLRLYHGMALAELGEKEKSLEEFEMAYGITGDPRVLLNIGAGLGELGRYEEAISVLAKVPPESPDRATARRDMGVILINQVHRPAEGLDALREAASLMRDPEQAKQLATEVERIEGLMRREAGKEGTGGGSAGGGAGERSR